MPDRGPHHGREAVRRWLEELGQTWEQMSAGEPELIDAGDRVVAVVRLTGRGMRSGVDIGGGTDGHGWRLDGGGGTRPRLLPPHAAGKQGGPEGGGGGGGARGGGGAGGGGGGGGG